MHYIFGYSTLTIFEHSKHPNIYVLHNDGATLTHHCCLIRNSFSLVVVDRELELFSGNRLKGHRLVLCAHHSVIDLHAKKVSLMNVGSTLHTT